MVSRSFLLALLWALCLVVVFFFFWLFCCRYFFIIIITIIIFIYSELMMNRHKKQRPWQEQASAIGLAQEAGEKNHSHTDRRAVFRMPPFGLVNGAILHVHTKWWEQYKAIIIILFIRGATNMLKHLKIDRGMGNLFPLQRKILCHWLQFRKSDLILMWPDLSRGTHHTSPSFAISLEFHDNFVILTLMVSRETSEHFFSFRSFALRCQDWT